MATLSNGAHGPHAHSKTLARLRPEGWHDQFVSRFASVGLIAVLIAVCGFGAWSSFSSSRLGERAITASLLANYYRDAATAVVSMESLERKYRLDPSPGVRARHQGAAKNLEAALNELERDGEADDREIVKRALVAQRAYLEAVGRLFDAVDHGDAEEVRRIDNDEADPQFDIVEDLVVDAASAHRVQAIDALSTLHERESLNATVTPSVFTIGLLLVALFTSVLRRTRRQLEDERAQAEHDALHDSLTGLPNRTLFADRLDHALRQGHRDSSAVGLLLIDLDRFKEVNDTLGHHCGDLLLVEIGRRLAKSLRDVDTIARLGGDEFAVVLPDADGLPGVMRVARRLRAALTTPVEVDGVVLDVEASIGVVMSGVNGDDATLLMQRADVAMYAAKQQGAGVMPYHAGDDGHSPERLALLGELRRGLERGELLLHFQPKVSLSSGAVTGVEALARWRHPERGMVPPAEFIPFAEHTGLIGPLTLHVLELALGQVRKWCDQGMPIPVAVNISARNLLDDHLVSGVGALLAKHGVSPKLLELEVTESAIMLEPKRAQDILHRLHSMGIRIAIDDFGAGYTSLAELKNLPITELKVDKSFILGIHSDHDSELIVRSIVDLGHNLGMRVVAEGIENAATVDTLAGYRCDVAQGYHLCRPVPAGEFENWYRTRTAPASTEAVPAPTSEVAAQAI